jgi:hypothetical protein
MILLSIHQSDCDDCCTYVSIPSTTYGRALGVVAFGTWLAVAEVVDDGIDDNGRNTPDGRTIKVRSEQRNIIDDVAITLIPICQIDTGAMSTQSQ